MKLAVFASQVVRFQALKIQYCVSGNKIVKPSNAAVSVIWQLKRLWGMRSAAVMPNMDNSSALGAGSSPAHALSTTTWQVAQVKLPPQSAAMASMPAWVAACIRD